MFVEAYGEQELWQVRNRTRSILLAICGLRIVLVFFWQHDSALKGKCDAYKGPVPPSTAVELYWRESVGATPGVSDVFKAVMYLLVFMLVFFAHHDPAIC